MSKANDAKQTSDDAAEESNGVAVQTTMGDMVPQDEELEQIVGRYMQAEITLDKAKEKFKAIKADLREAMVARELEVYHCRSADRKVTATEELTVRVVKDTPDGDEG